MDTQWCVYSRWCPLSRKFPTYRYSTKDWPLHMSIADVYRLTRGEFHRSKATTRKTKQHEIYVTSTFFTSVPFLWVNTAIFHWFGIYRKPFLNTITMHTCWRYNCKVSIRKAEIHPTTLLVSSSSSTEFYNFNGIIDVLLLQYLPCCCCFVTACVSSRSSSGTLYINAYDISVSCVL